MVVIAGFAGAVLGASIDPVLWVAIIAVIYFGRTTLSYFVALGIALGALLGSWVALAALNEVLTTDWIVTAVPSVVALVIWASLGRVIRHVLSLRRTPASGKP